jgi:hypothetical protein
VANDGEIRWEGVETGARREDGHPPEPFVSQVSRRIGPDTTVARVRDVAGGPAIKVESNHRVVNWWERQIDAARRAVKHANRPIKSLLKPEDETPRPDPNAPRDEIGRPMVRCPACAKGGVFDCGYCDQTGWVTLGQADDWRDAHGDE